MLAKYATTGLVCAPLNLIQRIKDLQLYIQIVVKAVNMVISRCSFKEDGTDVLVSPCRKCSTLIFPHSTNQIHNLWRRANQVKEHFAHFLQRDQHSLLKSLFRCSCRRGFLNSLILICLVFCMCSQCILLACSCFHGFTSAHSVKLNYQPPLYKILKLRKDHWQVTLV